MLAATHELEDGTRVRLRLTRPTDVDRIDSFLDGVDAEVYARELAFYDPRERLTLAATRPGDPGEEIVGLAELEIESAAVDVIVPDEHVERGLDELLAQAGAELAQQRKHGRSS